MALASRGVGGGRVTKEDTVVEILLKSKLTLSQHTLDRELALRLGGHGFRSLFVPLIASAGDPMQCRCPPPLSQMFELALPAIPAF